MEVRKLSEEEKNIITNCITAVVAEEKNSSEAIYINSYQIKGVTYIDVQFVKNDAYTVKYRTIACPVEKVVIRAISVPSIEFHIGLNHYRERCHAMNLLNSVIIMDRDDEYYKAIAKEANDFGFGEYANNVTFDPPIKIKKPE